MDSAANTRPDHARIALAGRLSVAPMMDWTDFI
mgnify:CR=1 FL=1